MPRSAQVCDGSARALMAVQLCGPARLLAQAGGMIGYTPLAWSCPLPGNNFLAHDIINFVIKHDLIMIAAG